MDELACSKVIDLCNRQNGNDDDDDDDDDR